MTRRKRSRSHELLMLSAILFLGGSAHAIFAQRETGAMALEEAIAGVSAQSPLDRVRAVRALGTFKSEKAVGALIAACTNTDFKVRECALQSVRAIGDPRAVEAAKACLMDKYSSVRAEAAKTITALSVNPGDVWLQIYRAAQEPLTKAAALWNLARIDPAAVATQIHAAATAMDLPLRKAAAQGLATLGEEKDLAMLRALAGDREVPVRLAVVDACCDMKDAEKAVDIVNLLRRDRDQGVRFKVIREMVRIDSPRVGVLYLAVLRAETVESLRYNAAELIRGAKKASILLKDLRSLVEQEKSEEVREALKSTIAAIEQEAADRTKSVGGPGPTVDTGVSAVEEVKRAAAEIRRLRMLHTEAVEKRNWDAAEELAKQMRTAQAAERAILGRLSDQVADAMRQGTVEDVERQGALLDEAYKNTEYSRSRQAGRPPKSFEVDRR